MCPLRFILVFFSALLAGYVAWRSVRSSQESDLMTTASEDHSSYGIKPSRKNREFSCFKMMQNAFWVLIDMASGRYLWRNLKEMREVQRPQTNEEAKTQKLTS